MFIKNVNIVKCNVGISVEGGDTKSKLKFEQLIIRETPTAYEFKDFEGEVTIKENKTFDVDTFLKISDSKKVNYEKQFQQKIKQLFNLEVNAKIRNDRLELKKIRLKKSFLKLD